MDYKRHDIDELEELALNGDDFAAEEFERRLNDSGDFKDVTSIKTVSASAANCSGVSEEAVQARMLIDSEEKESGGTGNTLLLYDDSILSLYRNSSLMEVKKLSDSGNHLASFVFGERLYNSSSKEESINGMSMMLESVDALLLDFSNNTASAHLMAQVMATCADYCLEYYQSNHDKNYAEKAFQLY